MNEGETNPNMEEKCPKCGAPLPTGVLAGLCPACLFKQGAATDTAAPEAAAFQPPGIEEVARLFPQLEILALIGKGGMGAVYKARQPALDRLVALKILPPQTASGSAFIERFNREARALAKLTHPNIVAVHEFGQVNGLPFFIMEFVDGLNLRQLERAGKLSPREALQIVPQICEALQFAHDEGIVHRDIKPENILVDKKGRVKIADFGIAKILGGDQDLTLTETKGAIGTPNYMAPEQLEKPTTVDHRADIFSLGVVFYEMLTGELPLGKFAPPSSRKVEVDVRLDEVVLRALERDPERRYQHISQVKTAVDTIAGSAAAPPASVNVAALAQEILARDYELSIRSCIRRGWALLRGDFWPLVGTTALLMALVAFASTIGGAALNRSPAGENTVEITSAFALLVWGPLMGGLFCYFLKKIRGEKATIETAFCGFSNRFLHLFLAGFVACVLTWLGLLCLVLPGIYLLVAWMFALPLVIDKGLDFWSAMELSRKVVTKHWWKFLAFGITLFLLYFAGVVMCVVGVFAMAPLALASLMYAYEDIFGGLPQSGAPAAAGAGPAGTVVLPGTPPKPPPSDAGGWSLWEGIRLPKRPKQSPGGAGGWTAARIAMGAALLAVGVLGVILFIHTCKRHRQAARWAAAQAQSTPAEAVDASPPVEPVQPVEAAEPMVFGPVIELELQARASGSNQFLALNSQKLLTPPPEIGNVLGAGDPGEDANRLWEGLDIREGSRCFQYISWLRESRADLMYAGDGKIIGFDGVFAMAHGNSSTNWDDWEGLVPEQVRAAVDIVAWSRGATEAAAHGLAPPPAPNPPNYGGVYNSADQLDSREPGGPLVNELTRDQSVTWYFKTREGGMGVLQLLDFTNKAAVARIRYKLVQQSDGKEFVAAGEARKVSRETLNARLEAAGAITNMQPKDKALATIATDAARAGEVEIAKNALQQMDEMDVRSRIAHEIARLLSQRGMKKQATEIAQTIDDISIRDQALSEIAQ